MKILYPSIFAGVGGSAPQLSCRRREAYSDEASERERFISFCKKRVKVYMYILKINKFKYLIIKITLHSNLYFFVLFIMM